MLKSCCSKSLCQQMNPNLSVMNQRYVFFGLILFSLPCMYIIISSFDLAKEKLTEKRLIQLQLRLEESNAKARALEDSVDVLSHHLSLILKSPNQLSSVAKALLKNKSQQMRVPTAYHFQPHLLLEASSLRPALTISKGRSNVTMALGIPSVKRDVKNYLHLTLKSILNGMTDSEKRDTIIIVFIAETKNEVLYPIMNKFVEYFEEELNSGLVEVIVPPASYYPEMSRLRLTLGDSKERVRWRTKQNLDFAFLMMYAQQKATFYVHLEDDVLAKPRSVTTMKSVALERIKSRKPWFVLDFCQLGFIGKMFRTKDLPLLVQFFFMFYNDQPGDWLLKHIIKLKSCSLDYTPQQCTNAENNQWIRPHNLFIHIGTNSSLKGKIHTVRNEKLARLINKVQTI
ncbi:hypothetical protein GE061_016340 [Apolygus lucorum]|uniref:MGAT4 conserved region domain-containing protein n=1 Tax=Apolygus lucorum TaxID=248454 RepID=A0A8S9XHY6_APOLU|nr:hypothetical protein GE061_016340 [Apolygus lucorum]